jgi:hypothetical protein
MRKIAGKGRIILEVLLLLVVSVAWAVPTTFALADAQRYLSDIKTLTQPNMEGRGDGTKGLVRAEHVLQARYKSLGLKPAGDHGYLQAFTVTTDAKLKGKNQLFIQKGETRSELKLNQEYVPFSFSSSGTASAPLVFAGYGATAEEFSYNDYAGLDVKDKIVVVLRFEPGGFAAKGDNQGLTPHAQLVTKAINARNHGAKGLILLNGKLGDGEEDLLTRFGRVNGPENAGILFAQVKNTVAEDWFQSAGKSLKEVQEQINASTKAASFAVPDAMHATLAVGIESTPANVNNVLAYLPGKTDEYVVLGAHYDHLGRGTFGSLAPPQIGQIRPGADDNASGTAGLLELARMLAPLKGQLQRRILFASFAGEEIGLLGSAEWVKQPTKPLDKAVAMLNMDIIGRIKDGKVYIGDVENPGSSQG